MDLYEQQISREVYLLTLYRLTNGDTAEHADLDEIEKALGVAEDELNKTATYLRDEGHIKQLTFKWIALTHEGRKKAEQLLALPYEELEGRVLWMINKLCNGSFTRLVLINNLARSLAMSPNEVYSVANDLDERKGLIKAYNEAVLLLPAGKEALEEVKKSQPPAPMASGIFITHFQGDNYGAIQVGHGNTQTAITNESVAEILPKFGEFIQAVKNIDFGDKDDVVNDLEQAQKLMRGEINEGVWRRIQGKLTAAKTTMEVAGLVYKTYPYWPQIWAFFNRHFG